MFKGILKYSEEAFHVFTTSSDIFAYLGASSFTIESIEKYLGLYPNDGAGNVDQDLADLGSVIEMSNCMSGTCDIPEETADNLRKALINLQNVFDLISGSDPRAKEYKIWEYDTSQAKYMEVQLSIPDLPQLIKDHEDQELDIRLPKDETIKRIQASLDGCIHYYPFSNIGDPALSKVQEENPKFNLYFRSRSNNSNKRKLANSDELIMASVPRRPSGGKYHNKFTDEAQSEENGLGVFVPIEDKIFEEDDPNCKVATKMRLSYNRNLGCFESGSQTIIVRLLSNLDKAEIQEIDMDLLDASRPDDIYDPDSSVFTAQFTTGTGMPMSVHAGNPNTFGPNIIDKSTSKKEKIRVVNRSAKSFTKGDIVLCTLIDNEWIVHDIGVQTLAPAGVKCGKWSFSRMIANADSFFRDDRFFETGDPNYRMIGEDYSGNFMRPQYYVQYNAIMAGEPDDGMNDHPLIARMNASPVNLISEMTTEDLEDLDFSEDTLAMNFKPSKRYIQSSQFDQVSPDMGGNSTIGTLLGRTNILSPIAPNPFGTNLASDMPFFFGASFPDGYGTPKVLSIKNKNVQAEYHGNTKFFGNQELVNVTNNESTALKDGISPMFGDNNDFSFLQLPAEIALNASPSGEFGSPIEHISLLANLEGNGGNLPRSYREFLTNTKRHSWISNKQRGEYSSLYDLEPLVKNRIQFVSLNMEMCGSHFDRDNDDPNNSSIVSKTAYREILKEGFIKEGNDFPGAFGNMFDRESELTSHTFNSDDYVPNLIPSNFSGPAYPVLPFYKHVRHNTGNNYNQLSDGPYQADEGAQLQGITAARNTIRLGGATSVTFQSQYVIGVNTFGTVTGGQVTPPTILPIGGGIAFGGSTNPIRTREIPQWGNGTGSRRVQESFGATNLRAAMYDHWPEEDVIYDTRYFSPIFFCAGASKYQDVDTILVDEGITYSDTWVPASGLVRLPDYERTIDQIEFDIDFRVPTSADPNNSASDNVPISAGALINGYGVATGPDVLDTTQSLRSKDEWRVNPVARGAMISHTAGFRHMRRVIGLSFDEYHIKTKGDGFPMGVPVKARNGKEVSVNVITGPDGGVSAVVPTNWGKGEGLMPSDFRREHSIEDPDNPGQFITVTGYKVELQGVDGTDPAEIIFPMGEVYDKLYETNYPKKHGRVDLLPGSNGENGRLSGSTNASIGITEANSSNTYDVYYYYTNDISHVFLTEKSRAMPVSNYVILDIGAT